MWRSLAAGRTSVTARYSRAATGRSYGMMRVRTVYWKDYRKGGVCPTLEPRACVACEPGRRCNGVGLGPVSAEKKSSGIRFR